MPANFGADLLCFSRVQCFWQVLSYPITYQELRFQNPPSPQVPGLARARKLLDILRADGQPPYLKVKQAPWVNLGRQSGENCSFEGLRVCTVYTLELLNNVIFIKTCWF